MQATGFRLAELLGGLSLATDLAVGVPLETSLGAAVLAVRLGRAIGASDRDGSDFYYATLLRFLGCTITAPDVARDYAAGDEHSLNVAVAMADPAQPGHLESALRKHLAPSATPRRREAAIRNTLAHPNILVEAVTNHCALAVSLADRLPLRASVVGALGQIYERWDGHGVPRGLAGEEISLAARVLSFATFVEGQRRVLGLEEAVEAARTRQGAFDPELVAVFVRDARKLTRGLDAPSLWEPFIDAEPGKVARLQPAELPTAAEAFGAYVDHKSGFTLGHSTGVAHLAALAARAIGLSHADREQLRIAALLHDLGRCGIPNGLWDKPGKLTRMERHRVETHTQLTRTVLLASSALEPLAELATSAHERADGSGYPRRLRPSAAASILAASDIYEALTHDRPWRRAFGAKEAAALLVDEAKTGRLAREAVHAVLEAAGHRAGVSRSAWPAGLSNREAEVLCWLARGLSNKEIAARLKLSQKTVEHHLEHAYRKTGTRSRASAAIFAVDHGLFGTG